jgi:hypothetical protein
MMKNDERNLLTRLSAADDPAPGEQALESVRQELGRAADPSARVGSTRFAWPWSQKAGAVRRARAANLEAQLQIYLDDLNAIRTARQALSRVTAFRAIEAAETAIFELRVRGETLRHAILARGHAELTARFAAQLPEIHALHENKNISPEMLDALRERALSELTESMKAASKARVDFYKQWLLKLGE